LFVFCIVTLKFPLNGQQIEQSVKRHSFNEDEKQQPSNRQLVDYLNTYYDRFMVTQLRLPEETAENNFQFNYNCWLKMFSTDFPERKIREIDMSFLKSLQWNVETDKKIYRLDEPIKFKIAVKNISDNNIIIRDTFLNGTIIFHSITLNKMKNNEKRKVSLLLSNRPRFSPKDYIHPPSLSHNHDSFSALPKKIMGIRTYLLEPNETAPVRQWWWITHNTQESVKLNDYYDLSQPGEYELTFYTRNYIGDNQIGEFPKPCTIRFQIGQETKKQQDNKISKYEEKGNKEGLIL
jgi:hypothetical protein